MRFFARVALGTGLLAAVTGIGVLGCHDGGGGGGGGPDMATPPYYGNCTAPARPPSNVALQLTDAFPGKTFTVPLGITQAPMDPAHFYIWQQNGRVRRIDATGTAPITEIADLSVTPEGNLVTGGEAGLLGVAFSPGWQTNHTAYLSFTPASATAGAGFKSFIARVVTAADGVTFDMANEQPVLSLDQPFPNHNGGNILFGPDGYLYFGLGDGGSGGDPGDRAQDLTVWFGKMLRIDVDGQTTYAIPPTNPFVMSATARHEIYAYGLRNPWRWSFDRGTGDLWVGDVGQNVWEEVDVIQRGGNYGWRRCEGNHKYDTANPDNPDAGPCTEPGAIPAIVDYSHLDPMGGNVITGGYVYRGTAMPSLVGSYLYVDEGSGRLWRVGYDATGKAINDLLLETGKNITSFGEGIDGELYACSAGDGIIYKLAPAGPPTTTNFPATLSATGCFSPDVAAQPSATLFAYDVNTPLWSDGADKRRWMQLPAGGLIHVNDDGDWDLPIGTVLIKEFSVGGKRVETRLLVHHDDGDWAGYSYEWSDDQTDATLLPSSKTKDLGNGQSWYFPSRSDCLRCHTQAAGRTLGLETAQMNRVTLGGGGNQLDALTALGVFDAPLPAPASALAALPHIDDMNVPVDQRARAYLHSNCSFCHRMNGTAQVPPDWRFPLTLAQTGACNAMPLDGDLGHTGAKVITPGMPDASVVSLRMKSTDAYRMPPLATHVVDPAGTALIDAWITSLTNCN
ncbi:MAG: PQQ-dependent sugar dehydrogenase [Polyangia bacterium]